MAKKLNIFIVIPAFNEEKNIGKVLKEITKTKYPVIVVDDGSVDKTVNVLSKVKSQLLHVLVLRHKVNLGKGAAMKTGAEAAFSQGANAVIFMDGDGQHNASDLPKFIKALKKYDVVLGSRTLSHGVPLVRFLGNKFASMLIASLFGIHVSDLTCGYRAITRDGYGKIAWESSGYAVETEMVIKTGKYGLKYCEVSIETVYLDNVKGVTILDAFNILLDVFRWRLIK